MKPRWRGAENAAPEWWARVKSGRLHALTTTRALRSRGYESTRCGKVLLSHLFGPLTRSVETEKHICNQCRRLLCTDILKG